MPAAGMAAEGGAMWNVIDREGYFGGNKAMVHSRHASIEAARRAMRRHAYTDETGRRRNPVIICEGDRLRGEHYWGDMYPQEIHVAPRQREHMKYEVYVAQEGGPDELLGSYGTVAMAQRVARQAAQTHDRDGKRIYVDWFRASDGQKGYLNPGEGHSITGKPW